MHSIPRNICIRPSPPSRLSLPFMPPNRKLTPLGCTLPQKASLFAMNKSKKHEIFNQFGCILYYTTWILPRRIFTSCKILVYYSDECHLDVFSFNTQKASLFSDDKLKTWNLSSTCLIYHTSKDISRTFIKIVGKKREERTLIFFLSTRYDKIWM